MLLLETPHLYICNLFHHLIAISALVSLRALFNGFLSRMCVIENQHISLLILWTKQRSKLGKSIVISADLLLNFRMILSTKCFRYSIVIAFFCQKT